MKFKSKYEYTNRYNPVHSWGVIGARIGLHLHITDYGEKGAEKDRPQFSGGLEIHYRNPPERMKDDAPDSNHCWLLECPCWHDGSSMQVEDFWIPFWLKNPNDHERMFRALEERLLEAEAGNTTIMAKLLEAAAERKEVQP